MQVTAELKNILKAKISERIKIVKESVGSNPDLEIKLYHTKSLKMSEKFALESEFNNIEGVNWVLFKEGFIEVNLSK